MEDSTDSNPNKIPEELIEEEKINEVIHKQITENPDSITIGSATKGSQIKVYGDFDKLDEFKAKIDNAREVRDYAQRNLAVNI